MTTGLLPRVTLATLGAAAFFLPFGAPSPGSCLRSIGTAGAAPSPACGGGVIGKCLISALAVAAMALAPTAVADSTDDPGKWPVVANSGYTSTDDPGWVFFRAYSKTGQGCGIGPDGTVGCDIVVPRNADGTAVNDRPQGPPGFYACNPPGEHFYCPLPPPGANQVIAGPQQQARYVDSDTLTFTRDVEVLPAGYRLVNGDAWCYVSPASPGGINCKTGNSRFLWSSWGGILGGLS